MLTPFTEYYRLLSFARQADGDFSYLWYDLHLTELIRWEGVKRVYTCVRATKYGGIDATTT